MSQYIRYLYNVYKDGEKVGTGLRPIEAARLVECDQAFVNVYAKNQRKYKSKDGHNYTFDIHSSKTMIKTEKIFNSESVFAAQMDEEWIRDWNNMRMAAKLLKTGHGKFATRKGKKVVVRV